MSPTTNQILQMLDETYENDCDNVFGSNEYRLIREHIIQLDAALHDCKARIDSFQSILKEYERG